ncbi:conserved Plasmodium protein, unknown function [Plasmodium ovale]|uniref:Uncharacterized protein n=1 Tax=Plasmodium ovale TaxID=36330 RepID=A0A1D3UAA5_PLAOA|nr:conserved Plasmodium protein, unknown function [Plasmodium ovale]
MEKSNHPLKGKMSRDDSNNDMNNSEDESNNENDTSDLEDLPEYERELILAKRHEEYMKKKHRRILLKNINIDHKIEGTHSDNNASGANNKNSGDVPVLSKKGTLTNNKTVTVKSKKKTPNSANKADEIDNAGAATQASIKKQTKRAAKTGKSAKSEREEVTEQVGSSSEKEKNEFVSFHKEAEKEDESAHKHESDDKSKCKSIPIRESAHSENKGNRTYRYHTYDSSPNSYTDSSYYEKKKSSKSKDKNKKKVIRKTTYNKESKNRKDDLTSHFTDLPMDSKNDTGIEDGKKKENIGETKAKEKSKEERVATMDKHANELRRNDKGDDSTRRKKNAKVRRESEENKSVRNNKKEDRGDDDSTLTKHIQRNTYTHSHDHGKKLFDDSKDVGDGVGKREIFSKEPETPERLILQYKEEKKIKLDIYKYMSYEIITYFQLKKTFLLDMSEHVNFPYYVVGHMIKVNDISKLLKVSDIMKKMHGSKNIASGEITSKNNSMHEKKKIFFIKNVLNSSNYFCIDRHTNIKFEIAHLENITNMNFFNKIKNTMNQNKKLSMNHLTVEDNCVTYVCDINNISDQKFTVDEYNFIKLFSINVEILKNFHLFLKEKIEDLKNFHYTEKQIQDLVEMKKKKSFYEIFENNKNIDSLPISRITVQREICSILRELDTLNYTKKKVKHQDVETIAKLNKQIDLLTKKKDILREQLDKARTNHISTKAQENFAQDKEKSATKEKAVKPYVHISRTDEFSKKFIGAEKKSIADIANYIYEEKRNFSNHITSTLFDQPMDIHNKIVHHFLHGSLQSSMVHFDVATRKKEEEEHMIFGINIEKHVTTFDEMKKNYG